MRKSNMSLATTSPIFPTAHRLIDAISFHDPALSQDEVLVQVSSNNNIQSLRPEFWWSLQLVLMKSLSGCINKSFSKRYLKIPKPQSQSNVLKNPFKNLKLSFYINNFYDQSNGLKKTYSQKIYSQKIHVNCIITGV